MRIRQVKPEFWSDTKLADLSEAARLFYIGLWMLADDGGWLRWDAAQVAKELYGFESRTRRERHVALMLDELIAAGRVIRNGCLHLLIPTLRAHQRFGGTTKQVFTIKREHETTCAPADSPHSPADPRGSPPVTFSKGKDSQGQSRSGTRASANGTTGGIKDRLGDFEDILKVPS